MWQRHCCFDRVSETPAHQSGRVIFLILDRGPAQSPAKVFVESLKDLRLFWLPRTPIGNPPLATSQASLSGASGSLRRSPG
jgi:hypothetical protein